MTYVLSRRSNGLYMLTERKGVVVTNGNWKDVWVDPGDRIGFQGICGYGAKTIFHTQLSRLMAVVVEGEGFHPVGDPFQL